MVDVVGEELAERGARQWRGRTLEAALEEGARRGLVERALPKDVEGGAHLGVGAGVSRDLQRERCGLAGIAAEVCRRNTARDLGMPLLVGDRARREHRELRL